MRLVYRIFLVCAILAVTLNSSEARKRKKNSKAMILRQKETNAINFVRLAAMRLIYGIATRMGLGEQISEALNGAFIPPGAEEYDYEEGGFGLLDRDGDDDYDY